VEGIVSKRIDSPYLSARGDDWIKTPCQYRENFTIVGFAIEEGDTDGLYLARRTNASNGTTLRLASRCRRPYQRRLDPDRRSTKADASLMASSALCSN
jgi:bifunctional non-homologous end joining protein LigD